MIFRISCDTITPSRLAYVRSEPCPVSTSLFILRRFRFRCGLLYVIIALSPLRFLIAPERKARRCPFSFPLNTVLVFFYLRNTPVFLLHLFAVPLFFSRHRAGQGSVHTVAFHRTTVSTRVPHLFVSAISPLPASAHCFGFAPSHLDASPGTRTPRLRRRFVALLLGSPGYALTDAADIIRSLHVLCSGCYRHAAADSSPAAAPRFT